MKSILFSSVVRVGRPRSDRDPVHILTSIRTGPGWLIKRRMPSSISSSVLTQKAWWKIKTRLRLTKSWKTTQTINTNHYIHPSSLQLIIQHWWPSDQVVQIKRWKLQFASQPNWTSHIKIGSLVASLSHAWRNRVRAGSSQPCVRIL